MKNQKGFINILIAVIILAILLAVGYFTYKYLKPEKLNNSEKLNNQNPNSLQLSPLQLSIDDSNSIWILVNKNRPPLSSKFVPNDLIYIDKQHQMRAEAAAAFQKLMKAADHDGLSFKIIIAPTVHTINKLRFIIIT